MDDLTVKLASFAMSIAEQKQRVATVNIANINNVNAHKLSADFDQLLAQVGQVEGVERQQLLNSIETHWQQHKAVNTSTSFDKAEIDKEVAGSLMASSQYRGLAEGISRKFGLYRIAIKGGQ